MKKIKLMVAALAFATIGLFAFKENNVKAISQGNTNNIIAANDARHFDAGDFAADSSGKKKRKDTTTMPPTDTMPTKKPLDSLVQK